MNEESKRTGYVFDERMLLHADEDGSSGVAENPSMMKTVLEKLRSEKLLEKCRKVEGRKATIEELKTVHDEVYIKNLLEGKLKPEYGEFYVSKGTPLACLLATGSTLSLVDEVCQNKLTNGICLVRPGGHHALRDGPMGYGFFAHCAIAAKYACKKYGLKRVLILDWDIHHGNGLQDASEGDENVMYISIHRNFYPGTGSIYDTGKKDNLVNVCFEMPFGDEIFLDAFQKIVYPVSREYDPELILIENGYDAVIGDPLGGCKVSPETFGKILTELMKIQKRVILVGGTGYNEEVSSKCACGCLISLLQQQQQDEDEEEEEEESFSGNLFQDQVNKELIEKVRKIHKKRKCFSDE